MLPSGNKLYTFIKYQHITQHENMSKLLINHTHWITLNVVIVSQGCIR